MFSKIYVHFSRIFPKLKSFLIDKGDILAKSFKWIYAKVCLCRICPGVAKRRALRERRKMRALTKNDINEVSGKRFSIIVSIKGGS